MTHSAQDILATEVDAVRTRVALTRAEWAARHFGVPLTALYFWAKVSGYDHTHYDVTLSALEIAPDGSIHEAQKATRPHAAPPNPRMSTPRQFPLT